MVAMRRKDRQVSDEEAMAYLKAAEYGVLSTGRTANPTVCL